MSGPTPLSPKLWTRGLPRVSTINRWAAARGPLLEDQMLTAGTTGFALEHSYARGVHVLRAAGQLVVGAGADHPAWALTSEIRGAAPVVIDLREVTALDARGVGRLMGLRGALAGHGARLTLHAAGPRLRRVLHLTRVDALLGLSPDSSSGGPATPSAAAPDFRRCA